METLREANAKFWPLWARTKFPNVTDRIYTGELENTKLETWIRASAFARHPFSYERRDLCSICARSALDLDEDLDEDLFEADLAEMRPSAQQNPESSSAAVAPFKNGH